MDLEPCSGFEEISVAAKLNAALLIT